MTNWERIDNHTVRTSQEPMNYATFGNPDDARIAVSAVNDRAIGSVVADPNGEFSDLTGCVASERVWDALRSVRVAEKMLRNETDQLIQALADRLSFPDVMLDKPRDTHVLARLESNRSGHWRFVDRADAVQHAALALGAVQEFDRRAAAEHVVEEEDPVLRYLRNLEGMDPDPVLEERIARMRSERLKELGR